jgi:hypothetical protein
MSKQRKLKSLVNIVLMVALLTIGFDSWAQDATAEPVPSQEVEMVMQEAEVPAPPLVEAPAADGVSVNLITVIIGLLTAFSAGGIMGIAGLAIFVDRINKNTSTVTALELLASSWPPETRELLLGISRGLESIGKLGAEVTDEVPLAQKPPLATWNPPTPTPTP